MSQARRILPTTTPTSDDVAKLIALVQAQQAQIEALQKAQSRPTAFKVSEKGCVTITGIGQYGMTVYASQWAQVLDIAPKLAQFITDNADKLSFKDEAQRTKALTSCATYLD